jgi:hypothetical protein
MWLCTVVVLILYFIEFKFYIYIKEKKENVGLQFFT